jgi:amino acid transporter
MATNTEAPRPVEQTLFVRKASGLVKGWSTTDGFRYSFFSTNIFLGIWGFLYACFIPGGSVFWAVVITTALVLLEVVVYAGLISAMPRAGGDYVWQSRVFHSSVGFVLGATGWWFILWLWIPIYGALCVNSFINPILRIVGAGGSADWLLTHNGVFVASLATIALATYLVAIGMKAYATFQKWALWIGLAGCAVAGIILLVTSKTGFINAFNRENLHLYGVHNAYAATLSNSGSGMPSSMFSGTIWQTFKLIPFMCFWLLWPNWGATLYGEVRGAKDFRKNIYQMGGGLLSAAIIVIIFLFLVSKTMGYKFFMAGANGYEGVIYAYIKGTPQHGDYLSPTAMIAWVVNNSAAQVILIAAISLPVGGAAAHGDPVDHRVGLLRLPAVVHQADLRRHAGDRRHVPRFRPGLHGHAVAGQEHLGQLGAAQGQDPRCPVDGDRGGRVLGLPGLQPVPVDLRPDQHVRRRLQERQLRDLHGHPLRRRDRRLGRGLGRSQAPGHGARSGRQGDPGRVTCICRIRQSRTA